MKEIGIDLAGVETKKTGFAVLYGIIAKTKVLLSDDQIIDEIISIHPSIVSIDAPLSIPLHGKMRVCEKQLVHMGIRVFPCMFAGMKKLTQRGISLAQRIERNGFKVIESYPGAAQDILNIPRKRRSIKALQQALWNYGVRGDFLRIDITDHELDAITSAIVGKMYLAGQTVSIGRKEEGLMVIPKRPNHPILECGEQ
jgi:predicted nuclease with RNAse H fold